MHFTFTDAHNYTSCQPKLTLTSNFKTVKVDNIRVEEKFRSMFKGCYAKLRGIFQRLLNVKTVELRSVEEAMVKTVELRAEEEAMQ